MNLLELISNNNKLLFYHPKIETDKFTSLFFFDKSMRQDEDTIKLLYSDNSIYLDSLFGEDMSNCLLFDEDELNSLESAILVFPSVDKYLQYVKSHENLEQDIINYKLKVVVCSNTVKKVDNFKSVYFKINCYDRFIALICYGCTKNEKLQQVQILYDKPGTVYSGIIPDEFTDLIHFINIPDSETLSKIRGMSPCNSTMIFYIQYQEDGEMTEDVEKYNKLFESKEDIKYDILCGFKDDSLVFVKIE